MYGLVFILSESFTWAFLESRHVDVGACLSKCELLNPHGDCGLHLGAILVSVHWYIVAVRSQI